jgi:hypothetical protein
MADFKKLLGNKWVLIGGAGFGVLVLLISNTSRGGSNTGGFDPNTMLSVAELQMGQNRAAMEAQVNMAEIAAGQSTEMARIRVSESIAAMATLVNLQEAVSVFGARQIETAAGVARTRIEAHTALSLDRQQNANRLAMSYVGADVTKFVALQDVRKTEIAADAENYKTTMAGSTAAMNAIVSLFKGP